MTSLIPYLLIVFVVIFLAAASASWLAKKTSLSLARFGKGWSKTGRILTFTISFTIFMLGIVMVLGVPFMR